MGFVGEDLLSFLLTLLKEFRRPYILLTKLRKHHIPLFKILSSSKVNFVISDKYFIKYDS